MRLTPTNLPLLLLLVSAGPRALVEAACGEGQVNGRNDGTLVDGCTWLPNQKWKCGSGSLDRYGDTMVLRAGGSDVTVRLICGGEGTVFHCTANLSASFYKPKCANGVKSAKTVYE